MLKHISCVIVLFPRSTCKKQLGLQSLGNLGASLPQAQALTGRLCASGDLIREEKGMGSKKSSLAYEARRYTAEQWTVEEKYNPKITRTNRPDVFHVPQNGLSKVLVQRTALCLSVFLCSFSVIGAVSISFFSLANEVCAIGWFHPIQVPRAEMGPRLVLYDRSRLVFHGL